MIRGKVKFYDADKGYGFIYPDGAKKEIFVHKNQVEKAGYHKLNTGDFVTFDIENGKTGKTHAINIELI